MIKYVSAVKTKKNKKVDCRTLRFISINDVVDEERNKFAKVYHWTISHNIMNIGACLSNTLNANTRSLKWHRFVHLQQMQLIHHWCNILMPWGTADDSCGRIFACWNLLVDDYGKLTNKLLHSIVFAVQLINICIAFIVRLISVVRYCLMLLILRMNKKAECHFACSSKSPKLYLEWYMWRWLVDGVTSYLA